MKNRVSEFSVQVSQNEFGRNRRTAVVRTQVDTVEWDDLVVDGLSGNEKAQADWVREQLLQMGRTLRRVPRPRELAGLRGGVGNWPAIVYAASEQGAWETNVRPLRPTRIELTQMEEVLAWLMWLESDLRTIVFAQALGISFEKVARIDPRNRKRAACYKAFKKAIMIIVKKLNENQGRQSRQI